MKKCNENRSEKYNEKIDLKMLKTILLRTPIKVSHTA